jgi:caspase domain-containing protein
MSSSFTSAFRRLTMIAGVVAVSLTLVRPTAAQVSQLRSPAGGDVRALVIGIDAYRFEPLLKGAVADALDIESALRRSGVADVTALLNAAADRATVMHSLDGLLARSRPGDLVILSIAGHGVQEPEHFKGSQPDGMDDVFILAGFSPTTAAGAEQRILGSEFNHLIRQFELKGAHVLFIADACHGGGLTREIDPRAAEMSYRQAPRYTLAEDTLEPISTANDAFQGESEFERTAVLAAVDRMEKAPEIHIPGQPGLRGALSYAVARALEGAADENQDGRVTRDELFRYVQQVTYQLSDQRQHIVAAGPPAQGAGSEVLYGRTRGVVLLDPTEKSEPRPPSPSSQPAAAAPIALPSKPTVSVPPRPAVTTPLDSVRVAVLGNQRDLLKDLDSREARFEAVATTDNPDLVWDPISLDVLAGADVIAHQISRSDLPSVIDRLAAVNGFKRLAAKAPQTVRVLPDDKIHQRDSHIEVQVSGVAQRSLLLFNITGDGTVQALYPIGSDSPIVATTDYKFPVVVGEPFGADQVVAITSSQRLGDLEQALKKMNQRRTAMEVYKLVERYAPPDARIGATSLYTAP